MLTAIHGTTVASIWQTMRGRLGRLVTILAAAVTAAMAATNLSLLNFRIRVMQPHDTPCELRPTVVVLPLPILPQDTQAQLGHRVLKMISLHFLESLCSTLAGYIPWRAIPRIPRDFPANTLISALFLFRFVIQFLRAQRCVFRAGEKHAASSRVEIHKYRKMRA